VAPGAACQRAVARCATALASRAPSRAAAGRLRRVRTVRVAAVGAHGETVVRPAWIAPRGCAWVRFASHRATRARTAVIRGSVLAATTATHVVACCPERTRRDAAALWVRTVRAVSAFLRRTHLFVLASARAATPAPTRGGVERWKAETFACRQRFNPREVVRFRRAETAVALAHTAPSLSLWARSSAPPSDVGHAEYVRPTLGWTCFARRRLLVGPGMQRAPAEEARCSCTLPWGFRLR
jgi:hypothetical protein